MNLTFLYSRLSDFPLVPLPSPTLFPVSRKSISQKKSSCTCNERNNESSTHLT